MNGKTALAMHKWPQVPHCYDWLQLDQRGQWRILDPDVPPALQAIRHAGLREFINQNYGVDAAGQYYFQNGPQRVYVQLAFTPWVLHVSASQDFLLTHTSHQWHVEHGWLDEAGRVLFSGRVINWDSRLDALQQPQIGVLDDRDLQWFLMGFQEGSLQFASKIWTGVMGQIMSELLPVRFGYQPKPVKQRVL